MRESLRSSAFPLKGDWASSVSSRSEVDGDCLSKYQVPGTRYRRAQRGSLLTG